MFVAAAGLLLTVLAVGGRTQEQKSCPLPPTVGELRDSRSNISFADLLGEWNEAGRVGQEVRDGKFAFVVTLIDACGGQPVKVAMTVTNTRSAIVFEWSAYSTRTVLNSVVWVNCPCICSPTIGKAFAMTKSTIALPVSASVYSMLSGWLR